MTRRCEILVPEVVRDAEGKLVKTGKYVWRPGFIKVTGPSKTNRVYLKNPEKSFVVLKSSCRNIVAEGGVADDGEMPVEAGKVFNQTATLLVASRGIPAGTTINVIRNPGERNTRITTLGLEARVSWLVPSANVGPITKAPDDGRYRPCAHCNR